MKTGNKLFTFTVAIIFILSVVVYPLITHIPRAMASAPWTWTKYSGNVTLEDQPYIVDASVIIADNGTYQMWYTHGKRSLGLVEILNTVNNTFNQDIIDDITNLDLPGLLGHLGSVNVTELMTLLDDFSTVIGYATSSDGKAWTMQNSEVLAGPGSGSWYSVGNPSVIEADNGTYLMWYTHVLADRTQTQADLTTELPNMGTPGLRADGITNLLDGITTVINFATSEDGGVTWTPGVEALAGSSGGAWTSVGAPSVIQAANGTYQMWYTQVKTDLTTAYLASIDIDTFSISDLLAVIDGISTSIKYATSDDGVTWTEGVEVHAGDGAAWNSVADPSVIIADNGTYEMWYTRVNEDLTLANLRSIKNEIGGLADSFWAIVDAFISGDFLALLIELSGLSIDSLVDLLDSTGTVISYATSSDGLDWTVQDPQHLTGSSNGTWSGVAAPSVLLSDSTYEMWFTEGIPFISVNNFLDLGLGADLPIGYASYTSAPSQIVEISVVLQGTRLNETQWAIPLQAKFYTPNPSGLVPNPGDLIHSSNQTTVKSGSTATANFTPGIAPGTYDITVFSEHTMVNIYQDKVIAADYTFVDMGTLQEGDCNQNGFVNIADFFIFLPSFGKSPPNPAYNPLADFDRGGFVNIQDFFIFLPNFGDVGPFDVTP
ncbi:hypothetical protein ACFLT4_02535 [Chloroflexota bacterium]